MHVTPSEDPAERIRQATGGGADLVLECVGRPETVASGLRALIPGGRLIAVGVGLQPPRVDLPQALFALTELSLLGSFGSHRHDIEEVLRLAAMGTIDIEASISHRLPLAAVGEALAMLRGKHDDPQRIVIELSAEHGA